MSQKAETRRPLWCPLPFLLQQRQQQLLLLLLLPLLLPPSPAPPPSLSLSLDHHHHHQQQSLSFFPPKDSLWLWIRSDSIRFQSECSPLVLPPSNSQKSQSALRPGFH